jgi:hypothetical protein
MSKRIVLTEREIEALLAVAGDALPSETLRDPDASPAENKAMVEAYGTGMDKLRSMLARRALSSRRRRSSSSGR